MIGLAGYLVVTLALPMAALVLSSITRALGIPPTPANWSTVHFRSVLTPRTVEALGRSLGLAVAAATLLVLLGALVAVIERRRGGRARSTRRWCFRARRCRTRGGRWARSRRARAGR